jgi:hypothetical protein
LATPQADAVDAAVEELYQFLIRSSWLAPVSLAAVLCFSIAFPGADDDSWNHSALGRFVSHLLPMQSNIGSSEQ